MASITQTIPSYALGISQQSDEAKLPGQVRDAVNVVPDLVEGLYKRPGLKFVNNMPSLITEGAWFTYPRDEIGDGLNDVGYIGRVNRNGNVRIWNADTGAECTVNQTNTYGTNNQGVPGPQNCSPSDYLRHQKDNDISTLTINDTTFICNSGVYLSDGTTENTRTKTRMVQAGDGTADQKYTWDYDSNGNPTNMVAAPRIAPYSKDSTPGSSLFPVFVELKTLSPRRSYALNIYGNDVYTLEYTATSVKVLPGYRPSPNSQYRLTADSDETCPYSGSQVHIDAATGIAVRVTVQGAPYVEDYDGDNLAIYSCMYTTQVELLYGGSYNGTKISNSTAAFTVNVMGINHEIYVTSESQGQYRTNYDAVRPVPVDLEVGTNLSASAVLNSVVDEINNSALTTKIVGNGIYITSSAGTPFNVEALEGDLFNVVTNTVNSVRDLPTQCVHGYIVNVINSEDTQSDDYYLKFVGEHGRDGQGHWEECPKPGQKVFIDGDNMPQVLKRLPDTANAFELGPYGYFPNSTSFPDYFQSSWEAKEVGNEFTNRNPSFINNRINKLLFHRNRLVMLSGHNVIMSQPDDVGNFWNKTALTFSGTDRIDIACSSTTPVSLIEGIEMNSGLVLFSETDQYLFTTDSDILNPETAKIYSLSTYNYRPDNPPFSLGTTIGFVNTQGKYSRFFEMGDIRRDGEPTVVDQSKVIPRLLPQKADLVTNSRENTHIIIGKKNTDTVFGFKYFNAGDKRLQGSWFRWKFPRNIVFHYIQGNRYYVVDDQGNLGFLTLNDSVQHTPNIINAIDEDYNIHLDNHTVIEPSAMYYDAAANTTSFNYPSRYTEGRTAAIVTDENDDRGRYEIISGLPGGSGTLTGDWTGSNILIGDLYQMKVEFPTIYPTSTKGNRVVADTKASLTVQRINLNFGDVGEFKTTLSRTGKPDYTDTHESSILDGYLANRAPYVEESIRTIPVYERNTNVDVTLISDHPSPATLQSMSWEGDYNNRYYKRI